MDGSIFMRFPGGRHKVLTLSYDDGVWQDVRLISIMKKHGLKGTFNINSGLYPQEDTESMRMPLDRARELYIPAGMEVAIHAQTQPFLAVRCEPWALLLRPAK